MCIEVSVLVGYGAMSLGACLPLFQDHYFASKHQEMIDQ
jgi:hypothetical protein